MTFNINMHALLILKSDKNYCKQLHNCLTQCVLGQTDIKLLNLTDPST